MPRYLIILKAKCTICGSEHIIFDSSKNGYDAVVDLLEKKDSKNTDKNYVLEFKPIKECKNSHGISIMIKIINRVTFEEFCEEFGDIKEFSNKNINGKESLYLNAFGEIVVFSVTTNIIKQLYDIECE